MSLRIIKAGLFDSIQDGGRQGYQHLGINPGGWMDRYSAQLANALLGKELLVPVLEMTFPAATILFERATIICITGAHFSPVVNGRPIPLSQPVFLPAGSLLEFTHQRSGRWCYLSLLPNLVVYSWLGSYSTQTKIAAGGFHGRTLQKEDRIFYGSTLCIEAPYGEAIAEMHWQESTPAKSLDHPFSFIKGPEWGWLSAEGKRALESGTFLVSRQSDRMGYRLSGTPLFVSNESQLVSSGVCAGAIQRLPNGQLIALMADHQTTGGYPRIGAITTTALSYFAQCPPGSLVQLKEVDLEEAEQEKAGSEKYLQGLKNACTFKMQNIVHASL